MPTPLKDPTLYVLAVRGAPVAVVAAKTRGEANAYFVANVITLERVNPLQAHQLGLSGLPVEFAKPEYDATRDTGEEGAQLVRLPDPAVDHAADLRREGLGLG